MTQTGDTHVEEVDKGSATPLQPLVLREDSLSYFHEASLRLNPTDRLGVEEWGWGRAPGHRED